MADTENLPPRRSTRLRSGTTTSSITAPQSISDSTTTKPTVSPLRITKSSSQKKSLATMSEDTSLLEVSPGSSRRNSPSTFQIKDKLSSLETSKSPATSPKMTKSES